MRREVWKAAPFLEQTTFHIFPVFLFSPEEFIDNPIDNLSITKNSKKMQKAVRGRQRPNPSCYSTLCQAMKLLAGLHIDIQDSDALRPCGLNKLLQSNKTKSSHYIEGYCIHTDNMGHHPVCSKEPRNLMTMTCQYSAGRNESSLPRATC